MGKLEDKLIWINDRTQRYLSHLMKIVSVSATEEESVQAELLLKNSLRAAFFYDFNAETNDPDYLDEAQRYKRIVYQNVDEKTREDLEEIEARILQLFPYEREIWKRVKDGEQVSDNEIKEFWRRKSADSIFYGRIVNIFSRERDLIPPLYTYTLILDILLDTREYEKDFEENNPNIIAMKLSQSIPLSLVPKQKSRAIQLSREHGIDVWIEKTIQEEILSQIVEYDFSGYEFFRKMIKKRFQELKLEFQ